MELKTIISLLTAIIASMCLVAWTRYMYELTKEKVILARGHSIEAYRLNQADGASSKKP